MATQGSANVPSSVLNITCLLVAYGSLYVSSIGESEEQNSIQTSTTDAFRLLPAHQVNLQNHKNPFCQLPKSFNSCVLQKPECPSSLLCNLANEILGC
ncbi:hypothetical protein KP509_1Z054200 [Ceratopteris richardii]|nr:hypothetical protein KP509_1Z232500 [Ceratopteris richardii]KAH6558616.1 hypothetical protein KP509_1Z054200 [Ceratopteris richardii]